MNGFETIKTFFSILPVMKNWIEDVLETHRLDSISVSSHGYKRLPQYFPDSILDETKTVIVAKVPFPPLSRFGLSGFSELETMPLAGIAYKNTFFVNKHCKTESLFFHELIHVVQWERLGMDKFLMAYGIGLLQHGYQDSPFEQMAYSLQNDFNEGGALENLIEVIRQRTDAVWHQVSPLLEEYYQ